MQRICALILCLLPVPAMADADCAALLRGDASLGRADANCQTSQLFNGPEQVTCHWVHEYRSAAALETFEALSMLVTQCLGQTARTADAGQVNHPDSFDQREFLGDGKRVSLSMKDKAALSQSLIFLSVSDSF